MNQVTAIAEQHSELCRIFANPKRILILWELSQQELSVHEIANAVDVSMSNASHHLRLMKDMAIVKSRRKGQSVYYRIQHPERVQALLRIRENIKDIHPISNSIRS